VPTARESLVDAVVVGGGPAGLVAAIYLARFRRSVVLVDAGQSRIEKIPRSHNYPGFAEGVPGAEVRDMLRDQLRSYPVRVVHGFVERAARVPDGFRLDTRAGPIEGRRMLLATGVTDIPPAMPQVRDALDAGVLRYCPVCDAYEVIGKAVGVYANGPAGVAEALYLRHFSADITLFMAQGSPGLPAEDRRKLAEAGIRWNDAPVDAMRRNGERIEVMHAGARTLCDTLYCALGVTVHSKLAEALGASVDETGYVGIDGHHATHVPGLYAAGDVSSGLNQIVVAMGGAAIAASAIHRGLGPAWPARTDA